MSHTCCACSDAWAARYDAQKQETANYFLLCCYFALLVSGGVEQRADA